MINMPGYPETTASDMTGTGPDDVETAVMERIAAWLQSLKFNRSISGQEFSFVRVDTEWPTEEMESFPVATVIEAADAQFDTTQLRPYPLYEILADGAETGTQYYKTGMVSLSLQIDIWCSNKIQRKDIRRHLEDYIHPAEDSSLKLLMPRYHDQIVRVSFPRTRSWIDDDTVMAEEHRLTVWAECSCPLIATKVLPEAHITLDPESEVSDSV